MDPAPGTAQHLALGVPLVLGSTLALVSPPGAKSSFSLMPSQTLVPTGLPGFPSNYVIRPPEGAPAEQDSPGSAQH